MSRASRPRRYRVAVRPQVRRRRLRLLAAGASLSLLGLLAALTVRHMSASLPGWSELSSRLSPRVDSVEIAGAPDSLAPAILRFLREPGGFAARSAALAEAFPAVKTVTVRRRWLERHARVEVSMRRALGRVQGPGPSRWLDEDGEVFAAPPELYPGAVPVLELGAADGGRLAELAAALPTLAAARGLPAPVERVRLRSPREGWELVLADGTVAVWGDWAWTAEKLSRLGEVLADVRGRDPFPGADWIADLRHFSDGRVLLRPGRRL